MKIDSEQDLNAETTEMKDLEAQKIIQEITIFIENNFKKYNGIASIILYGSLARSEFNNGSDVDICVLFEKGTDESLEGDIFDLFLDLEKEINRNIQCIFIFPEELDKWDSNFIENVLAEGKLIYGSKDFTKLFLNKIGLEPFQIVVLNLSSISNASKMRLKRILYGYISKKCYSNKEYVYNKKGLIKKYKGQKLGKATFIIPEKSFTLIKRELGQFDIKFYNIRVWIQKI